MHLKAITINGDSNVGLHVYATDSYVLVGKDFPESEIKDLKEIFGTDVHRLTIAGTSLLGVFLAGNKEKLIVPGIVFENETKILDKLGINYEIFDTQLTCLGNNLVIGKNSALAHIDYTDEEIDFLKNILGIKNITKVTINEIEAIGNCVVHNDKGCLIHRFATENDIKLIKKVLKVPVHLGTVNLGSPLVGAGISCNNSGFLIGSASGGPEMVNVDEALGFTNDN